MLIQSYKGMCMPLNVEAMHVSWGPYSMFYTMQLFCHFQSHLHECSSQMKAILSVIWFCAIVVQSPRQTMFFLWNVFPDVLAMDRYFKINLHWKWNLQRRLGRESQRDLVVAEPHHLSQEDQILKGRKLLYALVLLLRRGCSPCIQYASS